MVAVLTRIFGIGQLDLVEDVVQESFYRALQTWKYHSLPDNPSAWLMQVAKNRALDILRIQQNRQRLHREKMPIAADSATLNELFHEQEISDSQLRLMFACCHPALKIEDQLAFMLKTLSGFGSREIAKALLTSNDVIKKRLQRARQRILEEGLQFDIPAGADLRPRLEVVLTGLYLLFNEGYNSSKADELIRKDLCAEAMRLTKVVVDHPITASSAAAALLALMCYHAARFDSRLTADQQIILLPRQDRSAWDQQLIAIGHHYLRQGVRKQPISYYQLEAAIAAQHCIAPDFDATNWERVLKLYDLLYEIKPYPVVLLNRVVVLIQIGDLDEAHRQLFSPPAYQLKDKHYLFHAVAAELYNRLQRPQDTTQHLQRALALVETEAEKALIEQRLG